MIQSPNQNQTPPQEITPNANQSPTPSTTDAPPSNEDLMKHLMAALGPVVDFHKTVETASENDLRVYWDIRLVQGKDTPFTSMTGHSSFPGILVGSALGQLPSAMSREIVEKIAVPLSARLQDMTNERALNTVMKNVPTRQTPVKPVIRAVDPSVDVTSQDLIPDGERNEVIDVMLPREVVDEAAGIMAELKKNE